MADNAEIRNIPQNPLFGALASALMKAKQNTGVFGEFLLGKAPETLQDMSYGFNPTRGSGMAFGFKPEALDVASLIPTGAIGSLAARGYGKLLTSELARHIAEGTTIGQMLDPRMNMIAYHGSPHSFDKFDMSKIGTGEGAQAYGHGLYFADSPEVAKSYAQIYEQAINAEKPTQQEYQELVKLKRKARQFGANMPQDEIEKLNQLSSKSLSYEQALKTIQEPSFYKVDIADEAIPNMLLWDKPLSEQPVKDKVIKAFKQRGFEDWQVKSLLDKNITGEQAYTYLSGIKGSTEGRDVLLDNGIQGIRYLDAGSRGKGAGTMNTVVFDDKLVKILEKNGKPVK